MFVLLFFWGVFPLSRALGSSCYPLLFVARSSHLPIVTFKPFPAGAHLCVRPCVMCLPMCVYQLWAPLQYIDGGRTHRCAPALAPRIRPYMCLAYARMCITHTPVLASLHRPYWRLFIARIIQTFPPM
ncbi:MAG: hypothetical protein LBJ17_05995 [Dysgonamonadaceae bacterium]|nr:hypothetical protein [Dysgonamonadaceae bacterium]